jgi:hypothetical protein
MLARIIFEGAPVPGAAPAPAPTPAPVVVSGTAPVPVPVGPAPAVPAGGIPAGAPGGVPSTGRRAQRVRAWLVPVVPLLRQLLRRHRACNRPRLLNRYCPSSAPAPAPAPAPVPLVPVRAFNPAQELLPAPLSPPTPSISPPATPPPHVDPASPTANFPSGDDIHRSLVRQFTPHTQVNQCHLF